MAVEGENFPILREAIRVTADSLSRARTIAGEEQKTIDTTLTWMAGLMGAGLMGLPAALGSWSLSGRALGLLALPWLIGFLVAVAARLVAMWKRTVDGQLFVAKWDALQTAALNPTVDAEQLRSILTSVMRGGPEHPRLIELQREGATLNRILTWMFYSVHGLFALGILFVFGRLWKC